MIFKKNKFNNTKTEGYDSKLEFEYKNYLATNNVEVIEKKELIVLTGFRHRGKSIMPIKFRPDFLINKTFVDTKGAITKEFTIKEKLLKYSLGAEYQIFSIAKAPLYLRKFNETVLFAEKKLLKKLIAIRKRYKKKPIEEVEAHYPEIKVHEDGLFFYAPSILK